MDRRRTLAVLLAAALLVTAGAAPAPAAGPKGKVVIWYDSGAAWNPFIIDFNKQLATQYPDITVEWVTQDAAQLSAKLVAAFAAKLGPDIALGSQYRLVAVEQQFKAWADLSGRASSGRRAPRDGRGPAEGPRRLVPQREQALGPAAGGPVRRAVRPQVVARTRSRARCPRTGTR